MADIRELIGIMARLRDPERGCPWDVQQDFASVAPYTIEEAYEVADAIQRGDMPELRDELGDLLLQVVFHSRMAEEAGHFAFDDVVAAINDKLVAEQSALSYEYRIRSESDEARRREIEARGIRTFELVSGISMLRWRGLQATEALATSTNAKVIIMGGNGRELPFLLNGTP